MSASENGNGRKPSGPDEAAQRVIADLGGGRPGPLLLALGGIHGNEPAGVYAIRRVSRRILAERMAIRGRFLGLAGNLEALTLGRRFVGRDLNRMWDADELARRRGGAADPAVPETREQADLLRTFAGALEGCPHPAIFLDLHSTSGGGPPFALMGDTLRNRETAFAFGLPVILGLEENVDGTILGWFGEQGVTAVGLEGGQHDRLTTIDHHESALWIALAAAGLLDAGQPPDLAAHRRRLALATRGLPRVVEIRCRHEIPPGTEFRMEPGFQNFQAVQRGVLLARGGPGGREEIRAERSGILLLPRYQGLGQEGFFLGRRVRRFWLALSAALRKVNLEWWLSLLPGISRRAERAGSLEVDPRVARWLTTQLFHLMGYRRCRPEAGRLVFTRRLEGRELRGPGAPRR